MSNMENFSADELLRRLKENMGGDDGAKAEPVKVTEPAPEAAETAPTVEEAATTEAAAPKIYAKKRYKFAKKAVREADMDASSEETVEETVEAALEEEVIVPEKAAAEEIVEEDIKEEENAQDACEQTIAFDISSALENSENTDENPTAEFSISSAEGTDDGFDAPTMEIPDLSSLEAPDMTAFEAAAEDSAAQALGDNVFKAPEERAELDEVDMGLMIALGLEDELKEKVGEERVNEYETSLGIDLDHTESEEEETSGFAFVGDEYEDHEQTAGVFEKYKAEKRRINLRLWASAIFAVLLLVFEPLIYFVAKIDLNGSFDISRYLGVFVFIALQLIVFCAAFSYKEIIAGFKSMAAFEFTTNTLAALAVAFTALCDLFIGFFAAGAAGAPVLYNFVAAIVLVFCALHDRLNLKREMNSFDVVSSKKPKYAVFAETKTLISEREFGFENDTENVDVSLNVKKVNFVENYFKRTNAKTEANKYTPYFVFGAFAVSVILAIVAGITAKDASTAFSVANLTALMCLPISLFSVLSLPSFMASASALKNDSAIIGEASVAEYAGASTVVLDDKDVFPAHGVKVKSVKVYGDTRIDTVLYDMTSVYSVLGGPLCDVLAKATAEIGASEDVELVSFAENGVTAKINSERVVTIGDSLYMEQNDIFPVHDYEDEVQLAGGNIRIMYIAYNSELASKMYIHYTIDPGFDAILRQLHRNGMSIVIKTMDPNIDNTLLVGKAKPANYPAKIEKRSAEEAGTQDVDRLDSGIVSRADTKSVISAILLCDKLKHVRFTANIVKFVSVIVGLAIMLIFAVASILSAWMPGWAGFVVLYHLCWILPVFIISKLYLK